MNDKQSMLKIFIYIIIISHSISFDYLPSKETSPGNSSDTDMYPSVDVLSNGNYVITWSGKKESSSHNVYFSIVDTSGNVLKETVQVNTSTDVNYQPYVAADLSGGFAIVWNRRDTDNDNAGNVNEINARYYDSSFKGGSIVKLNTVNSLSNQNSLEPLVGFSGKYFYTCFQVLYDVNYSEVMHIQFFDKTSGNLVNVGPTTRIGSSAKKGDYTCNATSLGNGTIGVVYSGLELGNYDVYLSIIKESDLTLLKTAVMVNPSEPGSQADTTIALLSNGNVIIVWDEELTTIYGQFFTLDGTKIGSEFAINTTTASGPRVKSLGDDGFVVFYNSNPPQLYYQFFANDGTPRGTERLISTSTGGSFNGFNWLAYNSQMSTFMVVYGIDSSVYFQIFNKDFGICKDLTMGVGQFIGVKVPFDLPNGWVVLKSYFNGWFQASTGDTLYINTLVGSNDVLYDFWPPFTPGSFQYSTNIIDTNMCTVALLPCYSSCKDCFGVGSSTNHMCNICVASYYPLVDNNAMCYMSSQTVTGYFFSTNIWKQCYEGCKSCSAYPTDPNIDMLCGSCNTNYYPKIDDKASKCFTGAIAGYYIDGIYYQKCFSTCQTCSGQGSTTDHKCTQCLAGFKAVQGDGRCLKPDEKLPGYLFDLALNTFRKCYDSCDTCFDVGDSLHHNCSSCKTGYYSLPDKKSQCYLGTQSIDGYYFDTVTNTFRLCYMSCLSCNGGGDIKNPNCKVCAQGYSSCDPCTTIVYQDACIDSCPSYTKYDPISQTCVTCDLIFENKCLDTCPEGFTISDKTCITCSSINQFYYTGQCVTACPEKLVVVNGICQTEVFEEVKGNYISDFRMF
jgi:hypothetical protein